jgi:hypothetical protein
LYVCRKGYTTWGQMDTDLDTRTVLIHRRRQRR